MLVFTLSKDKTHITISGSPVNANQVRRGVWRLLAAGTGSMENGYKGTINRAALDYLEQDMSCEPIIHLVAWTVDPFTDMVTING